MKDSELAALRFPIGEHVPVARFDRGEIETGIREIEAFPARLRARVEGLSEADLQKRYRPGGWTVRQVVHHVHDSHTHSYIRFKWTLTEDKPLIKAYFEDRWAELPDSLACPVELSLRGLEALHARWAALLRTLDEASFRKSFLHPETGLEHVLFDRLACYVWHGRHHLAHIEAALQA
ncbi:MAG TPA: putative metal-dependent hydrolase [Fibrobacteria bacterium]|nr:putative metal-dependent hydrolase [Fibrobacteria bacterium]